MSFMSCAHCGRETVPGHPCQCVPMPCKHDWEASGDYDMCRICRDTKKSYRHQFSEDRVQAALDRIERHQASLMLYFISGEKRIMSTLQELTQALKDFGVDLKAHEAARDAKDAEFQAKITDLLTNGALDQAALKDAFDALAADKALIPAPTPPVIPPAGDPVTVVDGGTVTS